MERLTDLLTGRAVIIVNDTAGLFPAEHLVDHTRCAADARSHIEGTARTVAPAGAALYARVPPSYLDFPIRRSKYATRADGKAHLAACTFRGVK